MGGCDTQAMVVTGIHAILYTRDAEADSAWLTDVLGLESVDAGGGWLVFALPPAELAAHPASSERGTVELYLMCDDIEATMVELRAKGLGFDREPEDRGYGLVSFLQLPGDLKVQVYQPHHPVAAHL